MVTRHELLAAMHTALKPKTYLEVGVQYGHSLKLAAAAEVAIGIDPHPLTGAAVGNELIFGVTSDDYFQYYVDPSLRIDFAFIDGSHLFEDALRDFINIETHSHEETVVVFDDVLPYTNEMASRTMVPGHWTGDVWKVWAILAETRPDLTLQLLNTDPTGTMVVTGLDRDNITLGAFYPDLRDRWLDVTTVPADVLSREIAHNAETFLDIIGKA